MLLILSARAAGAQATSWKVDGDTRVGLVYARSAPANGPARPLVLAFHGRGDDIQNYQYVNLHTAWPEAVVVYIQGLGGDVAGWQNERGQNGDRDLKLVDTVIPSLRKQFNIDEHRIYATGFSNGAAFTLLLWAERADVFAAYGVVAGRLRPSVQPKQPRPFIHVSGASDAQIPFVEQRKASAAAVAVNGVVGKTTSCGEGCTIYGAETPAPVVTVIHPGGHTYPRGTSERIVAFFREHQR